MKNCSCFVSAFSKSISAASTLLKKLNTWLTLLLQFNLSCSCYQARRSQSSMLVCLIVLFSYTKHRELCLYLKLELWLLIITNCSFKYIWSCRRFKSHHKYESLKVELGNSLWCSVLFCIWCTLFCIWLNKLVQKKKIIFSFTSFIPTLFFVALTYSIANYYITDYY